MRLPIDTGSIPVILIIRYVYLIGSYFGIALGLSLIVAGQQLGTDSWSVLHVGMTHHLPISYGEASQVAGLIIILVSWLLGSRPQLATFLNMWLVGEFWDWINLWLGTWLVPATWIGQLLCILIGYLILGFAVSWCISANLGAGPRDQLMVVLVKRTGVRVSTVRFAMEAGAALAGALLGGPLGLGTVIGVLFLGPVTENCLSLFRRLGRFGFLSQIIQIPINERGTRHPRQRPASV